MRYESLVRLIEAADHMAFREIATLCIGKSGYKAPEVTDGWKDGGSDVKVYLLPPQPAPLAIQVSVERDWATKLKEDAKKIRDQLHLSTMVFISSRRIPDSDFTAIAEDILRTTGVTVLKKDAQALASQCIDGQFVNDILRILGIDTHTPGKAEPHWTPRDDAAYAFAFFGEDPVDFRRGVLDATVLMLLAPDDLPHPREFVVNAGRQALGLADEQSSLVDGSIDRMLQDGRLIHLSSGVVIAPHMRESLAAVRSIRAREESLLRDAVLTRVRRIPKHSNCMAEECEPLFRCLGSLALAEGTTALRGLSAAEDVTKPVRERMRQLQAAVDVLGVADPVQRDSLLTDLTKLVTDSPLCKSLVSGEVFICLTSLQTPSLIAALGSHGGVRCILDTSVLLPIMASSLYQTTEDRFFLGSKHGFDQMLAHGITPEAPREYVEEAASHLLNAWRGYANLIELDSDLRASENAFVAHYCRMLRNPTEAGFLDYLRTFGMSEEIGRESFEVAKDTLMRRVERVLDRIGIQALAVPRHSGPVRKRVEEAVSYINKERGLDRDRRLLDHDVSVLTHLASEEGKAKVVWALCTWDRLHSEVRARLGDRLTNWTCMDPGVFGDVLALAAPSGSDLRLISPLVVALGISDELARKGAEVWDALVRLQKGRAFPADHLRMAKAFKEAYVKLTGASTSQTAVQDAWEKWQRQEEPPAS